MDHLIINNGDTPVLLPHYMCELYPIELARAQMKRFVLENNIGELGINALIALTERALQSVTVTTGNHLQDML